MTPPKRLPRSLLDALGVLAVRDYLISAQSSHLDGGVCAWGTLNRLRDHGLVKIGYHSETGQRAAWITEEGREVWRSGPGVGQWPRPLTDRQREALAALNVHGSWSPDGYPRWVWANKSATRQLLDALVRKGWAYVAENGDYVPVAEEG